MSGRALHIGHRQHDILDTLSRGPASIREIADDIGTTTNNIHGSVRRLCLRRLVTHHSTTKRGGVIYRMTPMGALAMWRAGQLGRAPGVPSGKYERRYLGMRERDIFSRGVKPALEVANR